MDIDWQLKLVFLLILFFLSAFFSGSEVALFSLDHKKIKNQLSETSTVKRYLDFLLEYPRRLLVTILIGNTTVNVAASIIAVSLALDFSVHSGFSQKIVLTVQIVILTVFIVIFGELIPKVWASRRPLSFAKTVAIPLYWTSVLFFPIAETLTEMIKLLVSKLKFDKTKSAILPEEISELTGIGQEKGSIINEEHGLISGIVSLKKVMVREVMTPRVDMISVSANTGFDDLLKIITSSGHSRIPLYENDLDKITGIIYAKDILPFIKNNEMKKQLSLRSIARKPLFIPRSKMITDLMHEFQEKKMHIAIVVDEYGGTAGLITFEDILEEIIGEIRDEYDKEEIPITKTGDNQYSALGKLSVYELNEILNSDLSIESDDYDTLGGLILSKAGHIPKEGYSFLIKNYKFTVTEISNKRIKKVLIEKLSSR